VIYATGPDWTLRVGDARDILAAMPDASADCIVTSPPYWAKRDYGVDGQYGHEPDPAAYIATLVTTFREARRVLADDGTCWLNLGDSYSIGGAAPTGLHAYAGCALAGRHAPGMAAKNTPCVNLKPRFA
jgi:DNA modification methylase